MKITILIFFLALANFIKGQGAGGNDPLADSLKSRLTEHPMDTNRVNILATLSKIYNASNPELAKKYGIEGLELARKLKYRRGELMCLAALSYLYTTTGDWAKGIDMATRGVELSHQFDPKFEYHFMENMAQGLEKQKDFKKALEWNRKSIRRSETDRRTSPEDQWPMIHQAGTNFAELGQLDSAIEFAIKSKELAKKLQNPVRLGHALSTLGNVYSKMEKYDSAVTYFVSARSKMAQANDTVSIQELNRNLAQTFFEMQQVDSAEKYALVVINEAAKIKNPEVIQDASLILSRVYEKDDIKKSYEYLKSYLKLKDSLLTIDKMQQIQQAEFNEQKRLADIETANMVAANKLKQNTLIGALISLLLIAVVLGVNNRKKNKLNEQLKQQKFAIEEQRDQLKATQAQLVQSEKMASLGELTAGIAHEIQNPLNFVNNFSEVNSELISEVVEELNMSYGLSTGTMNESIHPGSISINNPLNAASLIQMLNDIKENESKINYHGRRADSIVKGMLQHSRKGAGIKEPTDINALCEEYLRLAYHGYKAKDKTFNVDFETHFDPKLPKVKVIPEDFGRVILNIINNAFYALSSETTPYTSSSDRGVTDLPVKPKLSITTIYLPVRSIPRTATLGNGHIQINISDNGPGVPAELKNKIFQPFFTTKPSGSGTGLGLSLAYDIVTNGHGGELKLVSEEGTGTEFIIRLPIE